MSERTLLAIEGEWTTDGRLIEPGALSWKPGRVYPVSCPHDLGHAMRGLWREGGRVWCKVTPPLEPGAWLALDIRLFTGTVDDQGRYRITAAIVAGAHAVPEVAMAWPRR